MFMFKISLDGTDMAFGYNKGTVQCWNWITNRLYVSPYIHQTAIVSVGFTPDGAHIVSGSKDGSLRAWIPSSGTIPWEQ